MHIRVLFAFQYLSFSTMFAARVAYSLMALRLGANAFELGVLAAVFQTPSLLFSYTAGLLADRLRTRVILAASTVCGGLGIALAWAWPGMPALYIASVLCGFWSTFSVVVIQKAIGGMSTPDTLTRNYSNQGMFASLAGMTGPLLAGYAIEHVGYVNGLLVLLPLMLVLGIMLGVARRAQGNSSQKAQDAQQGGTLNDPALRNILVISGMMQLAAELYPFYLPLYGYSIGLSASTIGIAISSAYVTAFAARALLPRLAGRFREERLLAGAAGLSMVAFALLPFAANAAALVAVSLLQGIGQSIAAPLVLILIYRGVPKERAGAAIGMRLTANSAMRVAGPPAFGALAGPLGLIGTIFLTSAVVGLTGLGILRASGLKRPGQTSG